MGGHLSPWYGQMILVSGYSVWQLPTDHNIDVRCVCNISFPVLPNYNTRYKSLKQEPFALNFSKFLTFTLHTFVLTQMCHSPSPMLSRAYFWSTEMTANPNQHWGGRNHTSVSRFLTSIVARKCEIEHWYACGADGRSFVRCTVTWVPNFLGWVDLLIHGAPLASASRARPPLLSFSSQRSTFARRFLKGKCMKKVENWFPRYIRRRTGDRGGLRHDFRLSATIMYTP